MSKIRDEVITYSTSVKIGLLTILIILLWKYLMKIFCRDPRLVKFAETLPGPPTIPIIGNSLDFYYGDNPGAKKVAEYGEKYGHIYRLWLGKCLMVGLSKVEDLEDVFMNSKTMGKPEIFRPFQDFWGDGLFTSPMHVWKKNRKKYQPVFGRNMMCLYTKQFNDEIYKVIDTMKQLMNGPEFDAWDYLPGLAFNIITKTLLDVESDWNDESVQKFYNSVQIARDTSYVQMLRPWLQIKFIRNLLYKRKIEKVYGNMLKFSQQTIQNKLNDIREDIARRKNMIDQASYETISSKSFLATAYEVQEEAHNEKLMHDEIITSLTGGTDTAAMTNGFFLLMVAIYQDIQNKLYDELYEVFGDSDRYADYDDVQRLPYLDQVLKETLRRFTLVPVIFKNVEEDSKIGDRLFPAGTALMISIIGVHFDPEYYPNPWKFDPENFSPEAVGKRHKLTFLPFGSGPRNCIGQNFVMLEMKLTLIALLRHFSFHTTMKMEDIKVNMGLVLTSVNGYKMSIKPRNRKPSYL